MATLEGQQFREYRISKRLGRGGFSKVYLAEHVHLKNKVALKVLHSQEDDEDVKTFIHEAEIIARLQHPHIIRIRDFWIEDDMPFLVMDYAPGGTLREAWKRKHFTLEEIVSYVGQISSALQYAHDQRVIHRDVKPENMLIGNDGAVLLSDFGIAVTAHQSSSMSLQNYAGTVSYMAPEHIAGEARRASDQYALAIVVYEWLSGKPPFEGSPIEIAVKHANMPPPSLQNNTPEIPTEVQAVIMKALAKEPRQRFEKIEAFSEALSQAAGITQKDIRMILAKTQKAFLLDITERGVSSINDRHDNKGRKFAQASGRRKILLLATGATIGTIVLTGGSIWAGTVQGLFNHPLLTPAPTSVTPIYTYTAHSDKIQGIDWSPDGKYIASGSADETVQIWNAQTGTTAYVYRGHKGTIYRVAWSPDGKRIASAGTDGTVHIWDALTGLNKIVYNVHGNSVVYNVAWSHKGTRIASAGGDKTVNVWDSINPTMKLLTSYTHHKTTVWGLSWSPDDTQIVSSSSDEDHTAQVWDTLSGENIFTYKEHADSVWKVAWSPDGRQIVSGGSDGTARVWNAITGSTALIYHGHNGLGDSVFGVDWSPTGQYIATAHKAGNAQVWLVKTGKTLLTYKGHTDKVVRALWKPNSTIIASSSFDKTVQVWDTGVK